MAGKIEIDIETCKGCEFCVCACPVRIIRMSGKSNTRGYRYAEVEGMEKCTACKACALVCPDVAITVWKEKK
jgi:2-oxoglutarate ferredoxin oxidoreductase subunit delta